MWVFGDDRWVIGFEVRVNIRSDCGRRKRMWIGRLEVYVEENLNVIDELFNIVHKVLVGCSRIFLVSGISFLERLC